MLSFIYLLVHFLSVLNLMMSDCFVDLVIVRINKVNVIKRTIKNLNKIKLGLLLKLLISHN